MTFLVVIARSARYYEAVNHRAAAEDAVSRIARSEINNTLVNYPVVVMERNSENIIGQPDHHVFEIDGNYREGFRVR
jgi:hypothetical protein